MRKSSGRLHWLVGAAVLSLGCRESGDAKTGDDVRVDVRADDGGTSRGSNEGGGAKATGTPSGPPVVSMPAFEVLDDGRAVINVQIRGPFQISEQKAEGRIVYFLSGVVVSERVNRLPLLTQHFPTQVVSVTVEQAPGGANLIIDLREPSASTFKVDQNEAGNLLTIVLPRSPRWGASGNPADDPNSFERPSDAASSDIVDQTSAEGAPEDYEKETERRRKKSKRQPKPWVERPLTLPRMTLAPDISISAGGNGTRDQSAFLASGVHFGIIDQVEVELTPHAFRLVSNPAYYFPSLGVTAGYTGGVFEIAGRARYFVGIDSDVGVSPGALMIGVPMAIHLGKWGRIDTGAFVTLDFDNTLQTPLTTPRNIALAPNSGFRAGLFQAGASPFYLDQGIPFHFLFQPVPEFWFGIHHGINILDFENVGETFALPLGAEIGLSASDDFNPLADLGFRADLPLFIRPGGTDVIEEDAYEIGVWFRWYYHL